LRGGMACGGIWGFSVHPASAAHISAALQKRRSRGISMAFRITDSSRGETLAFNWRGRRKLWGSAMRWVTVGGVSPVTRW
jgi:hypothetical protein